MPRLNHKISNNYLDQHHHNSSSLSIFPNEILSLIFLNFDISDLLVVCNVSKRFKEIGTLCFVKRLREKSPAVANFDKNPIGLLLSFEQEHKLKYNLEFEFESYDELSGNFKFKPKPTPNNNQKTIRFTQSSMVKDPSLYRVVLFGSRLNLKKHNNNAAPFHIATTAAPRFAGLNRVNQISHNNNNNSSSNNNNNNNQINNHDDHQHNFLSKSMSMPIKSQNERFTKTQHAYRMGDGIYHLKVPYKFTYSISEMPPPSKTRSGERWIVPKSFECPLGFFYPNEPTTHQIITMTMMALSYFKIKNHNHHNHHHDHHHNHHNHNNHNNHNDSDNDNNNNNNKGIKRNSTTSLELEIDSEDEEIIHQARLRNEMPREYLLKMKKLIMSPLEFTRRERGAR